MGRALAKSNTVKRGCYYVNSAMMANQKEYDVKSHYNEHTLLVVPRSRECSTVIILEHD